MYGSAPYNSEIASNERKKESFAQYYFQIEDPRKLLGDYYITIG